MSISLEEFKKNVVDLARPNRFHVYFNNPEGNPDLLDTTIQWEYFVKTCSLPDKTVGDIELNWFGKKMKIAGDPVYADIEVTFLNDYDFKIKTSIEDWLDLIVTVDSDVDSRNQYDQYKSTMRIEQLGRSGETLAEYKCYGVYPKAMNAIELSAESENTIEEFQVTFSIDFWERVF